MLCLKKFLVAIGLKRDYISKCNTGIVERDIGRRTETTGGRIDIILKMVNMQLLLRIKYMLRISTINYCDTITMVKQRVFQKALG